MRYVGATTDRTLLRAFAKRPSLETFEPFVRRYLALVFAAARRQTDDEAEAVHVTQAVFFALARRGRQLSRKILLADWLLRATRIAAKRLSSSHPRSVISAAATASDTSLSQTWAELSPHIDTALGKLPKKLRAPVLVHFVLNWSIEQTAAELRWKPRKAERRAAAGLGKLNRRLGRPSDAVHEGALIAELAAHALAPTAPESLKSAILETAPQCFRRGPTLALARSTLRSLTLARWKKAFAYASIALAALGLLLGSLVLTGYILWHTGRLLPLLVEVGARIGAKHNPDVLHPPKPWPDPTHAPLPSAIALRDSAELYITTNIWQVNLSFTEKQWAGITPRRVPAVPDIFHNDGTITLRNPNAQRNGVAGVIGFDYQWTHGDLQFSGVQRTNVGIRLRGNGTYLSSLSGLKHPYKVDLHKFDKETKLAGVHTLNFMNVVEDRSYMNDPLGYELFRAAGVPAPRTAYAWLTLSVPGQYDHRPLGLYELVENVDDEFARNHFGSHKAPIFKPVTPDLFQDLGADWQAYERIYDLKTKVSPEERARVIEFARLVSHASDKVFAARLPEFLDVDEFARFLAVLVLLSDYDSFLSYGQNYYMYLDPGTLRFGFIPWDLDQAWGSFVQFGTAMARERASIWHPWVGQNRFLERVMSVDSFRKPYRMHMERLLQTAFTYERLGARIDQIAPVIREAIAAESKSRLEKFDEAVSDLFVAGPRDGGEGPDRPVQQLKRFIGNRAKSVRDQLEGKTKGIILERPSFGGGG